MKQGIAVLLLLTAGIALAQSCDEAWARYNDFKKKNRMEPDQYAVTIYGAQVRASCGDAALPVPPGTDTPRIVVRRPKPVPPPKSPAKN